MEFICEREFVKNKYWFIFEVEIIYLVKIFGEINNLENYVETGDVWISIDSSITDYQYFPLNGYLMWVDWIWMHTYFWISAHYSG